MNLSKSLEKQNLDLFRLSGHGQDIFLRSDLHFIGPKRAFVLILGITFFAMHLIFKSPNCGYQESMLRMSNIFQK